MAGHADGDVTFKNHATRAGVSVDAAKLLGEDELNEIPESNIA